MKHVKTIHKIKIPMVKSEVFVSSVITPKDRRQSDVSLC